MVLSSVSQKAHVQTSGAHQGHLPGIYREQTGSMRMDTSKSPHPQVTLVTAQTETAKGSELLKEVTELFSGEQQRAEVKVSHSPCQSQLPDPVTSFSWHAAVPFPLHTQEKEAGAAHKSQNIWKCASAPAACTDPAVRRQTEPSHQLAHAKEVEPPSGTCLPSPVQFSNPANCSLLSF